MLWCGSKNWSRWLCRTTRRSRKERLRSARLRGAGGSPEIKSAQIGVERARAALCGEEVVIPGFGKRAHLPQDQTVPIEIVPDKPGEYEFTCGMNMMRGKLMVQ